jgi:hypothetical protein
MSGLGEYLADPTEGIIHPDDLAANARPRQPELQTPTLTPLWLVTSQEPSGYPCAA